VPPVLIAMIGTSCASAPLPRETTAANTRGEDPWLSGERCPDDVVDESGLRVDDLFVGTGREAHLGETVRVHYVAKLPDGTAVRDSRDSGPPAEIILGSTKTICGFERGLLGMRGGGERRILVPSRLAFGDAGKPPPIPPGTDLVFVVDLYWPADTTGTEHGAPPVNPIRGGGGRRR
jgi:FKBP-type peptidyl-prolyl cis-trans isomerase